MKPVLKTASLLLLLAAAAAAHAQLYKWVGPDGKVTYSDTPPPSSAAKVETKSMTVGEASAGDFPFELMEAMKNSPVTLYTTRNCLPCDDARKHLKDRGIPFTEKSVNTNEDVLQFRKISNDTSLPLLVIGRTKERGFEPNAWNSALTAAGYPETSRLPKTYRQPAAEPAAPKPLAAANKPEEPAPERNTPARPTATDLPPPTGNAPPGFRF